MPTKSAATSMNNVGEEGQKSHAKDVGNTLDYMLSLNAGQPHCPD